MRTGEAAAPADHDPVSPDARKLEAAFAPYFDARTRFRLDPEGRSAKHTHWSEETAPSEVERVDPNALSVAPSSGGTGLPTRESAPGKQWTVAQVLIDAEEQNDWEATFTVDLAASRTENRAVVCFNGVAPIGAP